MSSTKRTQSSRANGALSRGPTTPDGKRRSAANATRHGLLSRCVVLENESPKAFAALHAEFLHRFSPADAVELGIVDEMVASFWRHRRLWATETRTLDNAVAAQSNDLDDLGRLAAAFSALALQPELNLLHRYETRLHRMFQRALHNLLLLQNIPVPNEPSPISEQ